MEEQKDDPKGTGYKIENILLIESKFNRKTEISFQGTPFKNDIKIDNESNGGDDDARFAVILTLNFNAKQGDEVVYSISVKFAGIFEKLGETAVPIDTFKSINAPAIIYPFVREYVASLTLKAGIGNVLLPAVNFKI